MEVLTIRADLFEKIGKLNFQQQQQVLAYIEALERRKSTNLDDWFDRVETFQVELRAKHGDDFQINVQELLDEVREEPTDERLGRR